MQLTHLLSINDHCTIRHTFARRALLRWPLFILCLVSMLACDRHHDETEELLLGLWKVEKVVPPTPSSWLQPNDRLRFDFKTCTNENTQTTLFWEVIYQKVRKEYQLNFWQKFHGADRRGFTAHPITFTGNNKALFKATGHSNESNYQVHLIRVDQPHHAQ